METEIVVERMSGRQLKRVVSSSTQLTVGRAPGCTVQLDGAIVSREHAMIIVGLEHAEIEDYSTNGTFVGDVLVHQDRLCVPFGQPIIIGSHILCVRPLPIEKGQL